MIKGYETENGIKFVKLRKGCYNLGCEIVESETFSTKDFKVESFDNIREITKSNILIHYTNGENILSISDYEDRIKELSKNADEDLCFDNLEEEFAYRKFRKSWTGISKTIETVSDPLTVVKESIVLDTKNPFVKSAFANGNDAMDVFNYNRKSAYMSIASEKFKSLGFEFNHKVSYEATKGKKVWGNSEHSCIRYATAFGKYPFKEGDPHNSRGTLNGMIEMYNSDKAKIEKIIQDNYELHFNEFNDKAISAKALMSRLNYLNENLYKLPVKVKGGQDKRLLLNKVRESIELFQQCFK